MTNIKKYLLFTTTSIFVVSYVVAISPACASANAEVLGTHTTHLPLELKSTPSFDNSASFKLAAICALGDERCGLDTNFDKTDNDTSAGAKKCRNNGFVLNPKCAAPKINGAKCPHHPNYAKPCYCPTSYSKSCNSPNYGIGASCDGKFTSCGCSPTCPAGFQTSSACEFGIETTAKNTCNNADCYKCKPCSNKCSNGTLNQCNNTQIQVATSQTQCKSTCYTCRAKDCSAYPINGACPANGVCSTCPDEPSMYKKLDSCNSGFIKNGNNCLNDICPTNFAKTNNCEFGIESTQNTEAGTPCYKCKPCSNICSTGTLSTCNNSQIQVTTSQTQCKSTCYTCRAKDCSAYPINGACPANGVCSTCPDEPTIFKKLTGCNAGYELKNGICTTSCTMSACTIGSIMYSDKTCSKDCVNYSKTPIGVVFDTSNRLIVALKDTLAAWNDGSDTRKTVPNLPDSGSTSMINDMDGKGNTNKIIAFQNSSRQKHKAADFCNNYATQGTNNGDWFLPSLGQLNKLCQNRNIVNVGLNNLGYNSLPNNSTYYWWSSSQSGSSFAYIVRFNENCVIGSHFKPADFYTRPIMKF